MDALWWFDRADASDWPWSGGIVDQPDAFVRLYRRWTTECSRVRRESAEP